MDGRFRILVLIAGIVLMHGPVSAATFPKKPVHTNKSRFRIPFNSDASALQRMNTREIQLHVSRDSGATWELAQTLTPDGGKFEYQSPGEGEFWFSVKTLDGRNQLHPPLGKYETGLIVVVDKTAPSIEVSLHQVSPGKVQMSWRASDLNLDTTTLRAEYQAAGSTDWESIPLIPQNSGETSWIVNQLGMVAVRASISDLAGNVGQAKSQFQVDKLGEGNDRPRPPASGPVADGPAIDSAATAKVEPSPPPKTRNPTIAERDYQGPVITPKGGLPQYPQLQGRFVSVRVPAPQDQWPAAQAEAVNLPSTAVETSQAQAVQTQPIQQHVVAGQNQMTTSGPQQGHSVSRQRMVSSRRFQIGYEIENVGPSGVGGVELFITEDNGRKWYKYGDDPDHISPFDVEVPRDDIYGFSIRGRSGVGLSIEPPTPGELPEIVVAADQTPPIVELLPIEQGRGLGANQLRIRWKIQEEFPSDKPVSLQFAANPNGPWEDICLWREDLNGGYSWTVGPGIPSQLHIRVTVRDAVGNISRAESQQPIVIDLQRPTARIVDIGADPASVPK